MAITVKSIPLGPVSANTYILTDVATNECAVIDAGDFNEALKKSLTAKMLNIYCSRTDTLTIFSVCTT